MFCIQNQIIHTFNVDRHAGPDHLLFTIKNVDQIYNENYGKIKIPTIYTLLWIFSKSDNFQIKAGLDTMFDFFQL